uniref:BTB domain-containing protein n=1 Tax=Panagrolaimus davidi TaxID=227884 RepID=A0A914QTS9_9BILA
MVSLFGSNNYTKDAIYEMQLQVHEIFKSQNPEFFDVVFEIEGKIICNSSTFKSMLSDRWTSKNEPIKINDYKFVDFKQFLTYIYSGECSLTNENIFIMLDMAEFYQVKQFKEFNDRYLSKMELNLQNVFYFLEISAKYSNLVEMNKSLNAFISKDFTNFIKCDGFLKASKFAIEGF